MTREVKVAQSCPTLCNPRDHTVPWNSSGQNMGVGRCSLPQGIFPTQGLNPGVPHCRQILNQLSHHFLTLSFLAAKVKKGNTINIETLVAQEEDTHHVLKGGKDFPGTSVLRKFPPDLCGGDRRKCWRRPCLHRCYRDHNAKQLS